jgi:hypothetical protein
MAAMVARREMLADNGDDFVLSRMIGMMDDFVDARIWYFVTRFVDRCHTILLGVIGELYRCGRLAARKHE